MLNLLASILSRALATPSSDSKKSSLYISEGKKKLNIEEKSTVVWQNKMLT